MNNLIKRILTSIVLFSIIVFSLFYNNHLWLFILISASVISLFEFNKLFKRIWKKDVTKIILINVLFFIYFIFFTYASYDLSKEISTISLILLICIFSDIGGYTVGKIFGGRKLTKISPNKTISGSIGSFLFSLIPFIIIISFFNDKEKVINNLEFFIITLFISLISQIGDLFVSLFKRKANVKDTGSILPGHGGLLDRIDGIIFAVPSVFIIIKIFY